MDTFLPAYIFLHYHTLKAQMQVTPTASPTPAPSAFDRGKAFNAGGKLVGTFA